MRLYKLRKDGVMKNVKVMKDIHLLHVVPVSYSVVLTFKISKIFLLLLVRTVRDVSAQ